MKILGWTGFCDRLGRMETFWKKTKIEDNSESLLFRTARAKSLNIDLQLR